MMLRVNNKWVELKEITKDESYLNLMTEKF